MNVKKLPDMVRSFTMFQQHDCVNFICDHPDIKAISFVGERVLICSIQF